jgi:hypothetical protein
MIHSLEKKKNHINKSQLSKTDTQKTSTDPAPVVKSPSNVTTGVDLASACLRGFTKAINPTFCFKKGGDAPSFPAECPEGYEKATLSCHQKCKSNYNYDNFKCWEKCKSGYKFHEFTCTAGFSHLPYIPDNYTPKTTTLKCPTGESPQAGLCFRDCKSIGMTNCGPEACAASDKACAFGVIKIATEVLVNGTQFVLFVASFGTSTAAEPVEAALKTSLMAVLKKILAGSAKEALVMMQRIATDAALKKYFIDKATNYAVEYATKKVSTTVVNQVCKKVSEQMLADLVKKKSTGFNWKSLDFTGISTAVDSCKKTGETNENINCAKSILSVISLVDPTGLVGIVSAFVQPQCPI